MTTAEPTLVKPMPSDPAWDEAFLRIHSYLGACGIRSPVAIYRLAADIVQEARTRAASEDTGEPVALAFRVTQARVGQWFARTGRDLDWTEPRGQAEGRLALVLADVPGRWTAQFLTPDPIPQELAESLATFRILPGPDLRLSRMSPESLEFGLLEPTRIQAGRFWVPVRAVVSWFLIFGLFGVAWAASH